MTTEQRAELRIITTMPDGTYGLVWQATLTGLDLYAGKLDREGRELFRLSYHKDGNTHFYTPSGQTRTEKRTPLAEVAHIERVFAWNTTPVCRGHKRQPDSETRRTMHFEWIGRRPASVDLWVAGPNAGNDPRETVLREEPYIHAREHAIKTAPPGVEIIGTLVSDWTNPRLVVVLNAISKEAWRSRPPGLDEPGPQIYVGSTGDRMYGYDPIDGTVATHTIKLFPTPAPWQRLEPRPKKSPRPKKPR